MGALTPAVRAQLWRLVRLPAFTVAGAALITPLVHAAVIRWPAVGIVIGLLEVIVRAARPTEAAAPAGPVGVPPIPPQRIP